MRALGVARLSLAVAALVAAVRLLAPQPLELLDLKALDFRYILRGPLAADDRVTIVGIDEASLDEIGRWPWPRTRLAALIDRLGQASAIGLDIVLDQPDTTLDMAALDAAVRAEPARPAAALLASLGPDNDTQLAAAFRRSGRVVLGHYFEFAGTPAPDLAARVAGIPELSVRSLRGADPTTARQFEEATRAHVDVPALLGAAAGAGHINFLPDADGIYRRVPLAIRVGGRLVPALALEVLRRHLGGVVPLLTLAPEGVVGLRLGALDVQVDGAAQLWVDYLGPPRTVVHLRAADVLAGRVAPEAISGRIVLVGFAAAGFDEVATPFSAVAPGIELQATVIDNLLLRRSLRRPWWVPFAESGAVLVLGLLVGVALQRLRALGGSAVAVLLALAWAAGTQYLFVRRGLVLGAIYPIGAIVFCTLGGALYQSLREEREKRRIRDTFRLYLNPEVTEMLARDPSRLRLGGERRPLTILFSDVRGFTSVAERLPPETLGELMNEYLGAMTDVVFRHDGLLDKYVGDAVMALWGAPVAVADHAARCCHAAVDMLVALEALHERWRVAGLPLLEIGLGINTGEAIVGNFGSARRFSYTTIGDEVNLASRLEALNKVYGTRILVSDATRRAAGDEFIYRAIDRVQVRGRVQTVGVYELLGRWIDDPDTELARRAAAFETAHAACERGDWAEATATLEAHAAACPRDGAVGPFLARVAQRRAVAPAEAVR